MSEHAKLPWTFEKSNADFWYVETQDEGSVAYTWETGGLDAKANAAFIVEACNNHDRLTRENEAMRKALEPFSAFAEALNEDVPDNISIGIFAGGAMRFGPSGGASVKDMRTARAACASLKEPAR